MEFNINLPKDILELHTIFKNNGFKLFLVGGCVRDALLEIKPKDFDLVTDALPDTIINILHKENIVKSILETGKSFGVINVITENDEYEIATFRCDGLYSNGRRPDTVKFTTIEEDVLRRDLTINALYYDITNKMVIDLVDGIEDLYKKTIRTVGIPKERFTEDRLRILRTFRFASRFDSKRDFEIDDEIKRDNDISLISSERIRDEFIKIIKSSSSTNNVLNELNDFGLLEQILPSLTLDLNFDFKSIENHIVVLSILLKNKQNKIKNIKRILKTLKYNNNEIYNIVLNIKIIRILTIKNGFIDFNVIFNIVKYFKKANPNIEIMESVFNNLGYNKEILKHIIEFEFSVTGENVMEKFNIKPGPKLGNKIKELEIDNLKNILLEYF